MFAAFVIQEQAGTLLCVLGDGKMTAYAKGMFLCLFGGLCSSSLAIAKVVTLECALPQGQLPRLHNLYEIDYGASTIRSYSVDDDGAPFTLNGQPTGDLTYPAQITDNIISWTVQLVRGVSYVKLGRYSGELTASIVLDDGQNLTNVLNCHVWTSPNQQQKF